MYCQLFGRRRRGKKGKKETQCIHCIIAIGTLPYLLVRGIIHGDDLLNTLYLGGLLRHGTDVAASDESVYGAAELLRGRDGAEGAMAKLAVALLEHG